MKKMYLFFAEGLIEGEAQPEKDEYIEVIKVKLDDLIDLIYKGEITDSKTIVGAFTIREHLLNK